MQLFLILSAVWVALLSLLIGYGVNQTNHPAHRRKKDVFIVGGLAAAVLLFFYIVNMLLYILILQPQNFLS